MSQHPDYIVSKFCKIFDKLNIISTVEEAVLWSNLTLYIYSNMAENND